ncbi:glycyl radical protein [Chloroflexota bacterium]
MVISSKKEFDVPQVAERLEEDGYTSRVQQARERVLGCKPSIDLERAKIVTESFIQTEGDPVVMRHAKAFREQCQRKKLLLQDGELIVGSPGGVIRAGNLAPDTKWQLVGEELDTISTRPQDPFQITEEQKQLMRDFIIPYWQGKSLYDAWLARRPEDITQLYDGTGLLFPDVQVEQANQYTADYEWLINSGTRGIRDRVEQKLASLDAAQSENYDKIVYLNALLIVCEGMEILAQRYAQMAVEKAKKEKDPQRKAELLKIAEICQRVPANPARTFWEALQSLWFYQVHMLMEQPNKITAPGRIDQYLYPFFRGDIDAQRITRGAAQELLECLYVKFAETCFVYSERTARYFAGYIPYQNVCCGGVNREGQDAVNELSYMMLQAMMDVRLFQPSLTVKYARGKNPDLFLHKVAELVALGTGFPAIFNDEIGIKTTIEKGATLEEACNWNPGGCVTPSLMGKLRYLSEGGEVNLGGAVELVLTDGVNRLTGKRMPVPRTGDPRNFKSYGEFETAVKTQLAYLVKKAVEASHIVQTICMERRPLPVVSVTHKDCIDKALDIECGGAKYDAGYTYLLVGVADIINSLAVVKHLIYDSKQLTWDRLLSALENDFEGYRDVRRMCLSAPKYGNDIPEVDAIATEICQFATEEVRKYRGILGGRCQAMSSAVSTHVAHGSYIGALPTGRKSGQPMSDGLSPMQGTDDKGPTAVLKSASKLNHQLFAAGNVLNMKLDPALFNDERGKSNFITLIKSMCDLGLYHSQYNVISPEILMDAQKHPEKHRGLLVRVAGYTAYFVELGKEVQDDIISRTTIKVLL